MRRRDEFDVVIVGSGFGGSVAALRLTEKGYKVAVLEAGARFKDLDFPKTSWDIRKFLWAPRIGCYGIQRLHLLPDVLIMAGAGVGGGSLVYANTLYKPPAQFFDDPQWNSITDWAKELDPYYDQASRMLGVAMNPLMSPSDEVMRSVAKEMGVESTFTLAPLGIHFGQGPGHVSPDPYFGGVGPDRPGCRHCGACMTGCRFGAKNTLPKNYLGLAEQAGATVFAMTSVDVVHPRSDGRWSVRTHRTGPIRRGRQEFIANQVVIAAGTYGTQKLLHRMKETGHLPHISSTLGRLSRTNSESLVGAVVPKRKSKGQDFTVGAAITSSFFPEPQTHVEPVRYGVGSNVMGLLATVLTDGHAMRSRTWVWLKALARNPVKALRLTLDVRDWSRRTVIALVMQPVDNSLTVSMKRRLGRFWMTTSQGEGEPNPTWIPAGNEAARRIAQHIGGEPMGSFADLVSAPLTAHFVGGAVIGATIDRGVIDPYHRVWGYPGLSVVDGSSVPANLGVNPSLTITALAERAFALWPNKGDADIRPVDGQFIAMKPIAPRHPVVPDHAPAALRLS